MQQMQHLRAKQTRNTGRTEVRIIANVRKIMANTVFQRNENDKNKKYKITTIQNFSANMRSVFRKLSGSNCWM
jgi:hypothetical protein